MSTHVTRVLCAADPAGSEEAVARLAEAAAAHDAQLILIAGDLGAGGGSRASYGKLFRTATQRQAFCYWVPGANDAPIGTYLREAVGAETMFASLRGVHGLGTPYATVDLLAGDVELRELVTA
jgi:Icc-related predicted phosphoesterase